MTKDYVPIENNHKCPLCEHPATFKNINLGKQMIFSCPTCVSFVVYKDAEENLLELPEKDRQKLSTYARECDKKTILVLDVKRKLADIINVSRGPFEVYYATIYPYYGSRDNYK